MSQDQTKDYSKQPIELVIDPYNTTNTNVAGIRSFSHGRKLYAPAFFSHHHPHHHHWSRLPPKLPVTFRIPGVGFGPPYF